MGFGVAEVGVMRIAGGDDGLVVAPPLPQVGENLANRLEAQADIAGGEFRHRKAPRLLLAHSPVPLRFLADVFGVFRVDEELGDGGAVVRVALEPFLAEEFFLLETRRRSVALEFRAASPRKVEGGAIREFQVLRELLRRLRLETNVHALQQATEGALPLVVGKAAFPLPWDGYAEVVDLLEDAELLRVGVGARGAPLVHLEGAPSGLDFLERTLMEYDLAERVPLGGRDLVMLRLPLLDQIELVHVHCAFRVEFLSGAGADGLALFPSVGEKLAQRLLRVAERAAQPFSVETRLRRLLLVLAAARFAIGLESAPLVQVKEGAAQFVGRKRLAGEGALPQRVGVAARQFLALVRIRRHQAKRDECAQQFAPARQVAVAAAALAPRKAAALGERLAFLRRAPVGEDAAAHSEDAARVAVRVKRDRRPSDGVRADVQPEPVRDFRFAHSRSSPCAANAMGVV